MPRGESSSSWSLASDPRNARAPSTSEPAHKRKTRAQSPLVEASSWPVAVLPTMPGSEAAVLLMAAGKTLAALAVVCY